MIKKLTFLNLLLLLIVSCSENKKIYIQKEYDFVYELDNAILEGHNIYPDWITLNDPEKGEMTYWGIFEHAPGKILFQDVYLGEDSTIEFNIGVLPGAWEKAGDGVLFEIDIKRRNGEQKNIFSHYIDPKKNPDERRWLPEKIAAGEIKNETVEISFNTYPSFDKKNGNDICDWAVWGDPILKSKGRETKKVEIKTNKKNVILITLDTCRSDYIGCYGNQWIQTPNLDRLAAEGVLFENSFSASSTTASSHVSILTSLQPNQHNAINNGRKIPNALPRMPQYMVEADYKTGAAVSVHYLIDAYSGLGKWFDSFNNLSLKWLEKGVDLPHMTRGGRATTSAAIDWFEKLHGEPFFFWIHYYDPHAPYMAEGEFHKKYYQGDPKSLDHQSMDRAIYQTAKIESENSPNWVKSFRDLDYFQKEYGAEISFVDSQIGRLIDSLQNLGLLENTIIVVTGDHGENLGEHDIFFDHWTLFNTDIRVPLIFWGPGSIPKGKRIAETATHIDILPTILDLTDGLDNPLANELVAGVSLRPYWENPKDIKKRIVTSDGLLYTEIAGWDDRYKVIWEVRDAPYHARKELRMDRVWVYDRKKDPEELNPIACFYWGNETDRESYRKQLREALIAIQGENKDDLQLEMKLKMTKEWVSKKVLPSVDELRKLLIAGVDNVKLNVEYAEDSAFVPAIQAILTKLMAGMNPIPWKNRLKNIADFSILADDQFESVAVTDQYIKELLNSLGYK